MLNKLLNPLIFISADYIKKRYLGQCEEIGRVEELYQSLETFRLNYEIKLKNVESYYKSIKNNPNIPYEIK